MISDKNTPTLEGQQKIFNSHLRLFFHFLINIMAPLIHHSYNFYTLPILLFLLPNILHHLHYITPNYDFFVYAFVLLVRAWWGQGGSRASLTHTLLLNSGMCCIVFPAPPPPFLIRLSKSQCVLHRHPSVSVSSSSSCACHSCWCPPPSAGTTSRAAVGVSRAASSPFPSPCTRCPPQRKRCRHRWARGGVPGGIHWYCHPRPHAPVSAELTETSSSRLFSVCRPAHENIQSKLGLVIKITWTGNG